MNEEKSEKAYPARFLTDSELRSYGPPTTFDNTLLSQYEECPRKFYWFLRGVLPSEEPIWFVAGRAWQRALVKWYERPDGEKSERVQECYREIDNEFSASSVSLESLHDEKRNPENLKNLFDRYVTEFPSEPWEPLAMEVGFVLPFYQSPWMLGGALDGYIDWKSQGLFVLENKTTSSWLNERYRRQWHRDTQITQYFWALRELVENPAGVLMNHASLDIPKRSSTKRELFMRHLEYRSEEQMNQFIHRTFDLLNGISAEWLKSPAQSFSCHGQMCYGKLAFGPCLYAQLCDSDIPFTELNPMNYPG